MRGVNLMLLLGPVVPMPAPRLFTESLESVEVTQSDEGRSGFQIVFRVGRSGSSGLQEYQLLAHPLLRTFNRVIVVVTINGFPRVLMDGIITNQQFSPSAEAGQASFTLTGEDVSVMMDRKTKSEMYPAQDETIIVNRLVLSYAKYGLVPLVIPPPSLDRPIPVERSPTQQVTDLQYIKDLAARFGYVFFIVPGPAVGANLAYWGPPIRVGIPQKAITVNMGGQTNATSLSFQHNPLEPKVVEGQVQDRVTNRQIPVRSFTTLRVPLSMKGALNLIAPTKQTEQFRESGRSLVQAFSRAQATTDQSIDNVVTISGELDTVRYGNLLQLRQLVGLRGVGYSYDGLYYVKRVNHTIRQGEYKQNFTITRDGLFTTVPILPV
ncbi:MAG TPA: hypothetical protein IGS37_15675 [Synechococcales cyanobacterium M55_K2018_004]|nr:hypothetical protein [Synechococcales cyanobacterium M55_K2018_004]